MTLLVPYWNIFLYATTMHRIASTGIGWHTAARHRTALNGKKLPREKEKRKYPVDKFYRINQKYREGKSRENRTG